MSLLPWDYAAGIAVASCAVGFSLTRVPGRKLRVVSLFTRELGLIFALYTLWQLGADLSITKTSHALTHAAAISHIEQLLYFPSEASVQQLILGNSILVQSANIYYAAVHFPLTIGFLLWVFFRYRNHYRPVRSVLAVTTFICLVIQLVPVAPPRMTPEIVDTGREFGQSVYHSGMGAAELAAMPSIHVAWAVVVGYYIWRLAQSRWRIFGPINIVLTIIVVVVTGNHWWLDAIAAIATVMAAIYIVSRARAWAAQYRERAADVVEHDEETVAA